MAVKTLNVSLMSYCINGLPGEQPLFVAMNLGSKQVFEQPLKVPNWYGQFSGVDILISTNNGVFYLVEDGGIQIKLPPFTFL